MKIIPVIDLLDGNVVHAQGGDRKNYQPVNTELCKVAEPGAVLEAFLSVYTFKIIYIADLNAIQKTGNNKALISRFIAKYPEITFWIDDGRSPPQTTPYGSNSISVIGTESVNVENWQVTKAQKTQYILSLDFKENQHLGPDAVLTDYKSWPETVIILELSQVGSSAGPNLARLTALTQHIATGKMIAAGGIRNMTDLESLVAIKCWGALIASALHDKTISASDIEKISHISER